MQPTDKTVMLAVKGGHLDEFDVLFRRHHDRLFAFFYRMTADPPASEDLAQEVFVRMLKYRNTFGEDSDFSGWMYQIARNVRADHFRKRRQESMLIEQTRVERVEHRAPPSHEFEKEAQLSVLQRALLALPEEKRELLILARFEEMKYETIAELLSIEVGAVKVRVHRAVRELRALFLEMSGERSKCDVKTSKTILRST
jgi:RNA polymerase sigma-70 factor (ECF subfamily)